MEHAKAFFEMVEPAYATRPAIIRLGLGLGAYVSDGLYRDLGRWGAGRHSTRGAADGR